MKHPVDYLILIIYSLRIHEAFLKHLGFMLVFENEFDV